MATKTATQAKAKPAATKTAAAPSSPKDEKASVPALRKGSEVTELSDDMKRMLAEDEGKGVSTNADDVLTPLIYIIQPTSPYHQKRNDKYIEGAEPGMMLLRNFDAPLQTEIWFQPCHLGREWVEWAPRTQGGGLQGRHDGTGPNGREPPKGAVEYRDPERPKVKKWRMPNGNDVVDTRYWTGNVLLDDGRVMPYTIPLSSTGHTFAKDLNTWCGRQTNEATGGIAPSFAFKYKLITESKSNNAGEWYVYKIVEFEKIFDPNVYTKGRMLQKAFESKSMRAGDVEDDLNAGEVGGISEGDPNERM